MVGRKGWREGGGADVICVINGVLYSYIGTYMYMYCTVLYCTVSYCTYYNYVYVLCVLHTV